MNAVIYARFSSHNQREESIEGQVRVCKEYAAAHEMTVIDIYADRGISGRSADNRAEFQRMVKDSAKRQFQYVIMWAMDRFARNVYDAARYEAILLKNNVRLCYTQQQIPDTPEGVILKSVLAGFNQYYSEQLSLNIKRGKAENARKGITSGGNCPTGYVVEDQRLKIDPVGAAAVRLIFERYAAGSSIKEIVDELNEKGYKTTRGKSFRLDSLRTILRNRKYIGEMNASGITVKDCIPPIVSKELFEQVQHKLAVTAKAKAHNKSDVNYMLTTKIFCGHCGAPMVGESGKGKSGSMYRYYKCGTRKHRIGICKKCTERKEWIEKVVVEETVKRVLNPETIGKTSVLAAEMLEKESSNDAMIASLKKEIKDTEKAVKNLLRVIEQGMDISAVKDRLTELDEKKTDLVARLAREQVKRPVLSADRIAFWLLSFANGDVSDPEYQQRVIDSLINRIEVFDEGSNNRRFVITFNLVGDNQSLLTSSDITRLAPPKHENPNTIFVIARKLVAGFSFYICPPKNHLIG